MYEKGRSQIHTISHPKYNQLIEPRSLRVRRQRRLARVPEEISADLRVSERLHVGLVAVDAAAGFVEADDGYAVRGGGVGAGGVFAGEVGVEAFGGEDEDYVDWMGVLVWRLIGGLG